MKTVQQFIKAKAGIMAFLGLIILSLSSCLKDNNNVTPLPPAAYVSVINALPGSQSVEVYFDQNLATQYALNFGNNQDYIAASTGKRTITYYTTGSKQKLQSDTITLQGNKNYSAYLTGTTAQPEVVILKDEATQPDAGKAIVRLVNVSANAPAISLVVRNGATLATSIAYKGASPFVQVQGNTAYTMDVVQAGTSTILGTVSNVNIKNNGVYTVWLYGSATATDTNKLTAGLQVNGAF
jgi:hypothetical protein